MVRSSSTATTREHELSNSRWAVVEFHLNDEYVGGIRSAANYTNALHIQRGVQHWRDMGVQCVLPHIGLQNWNAQINLLTSQLCGYVDDRPKDSLRVIMEVLGAPPSQPSPVLVQRLEAIESRVESLQLPVLPTVTTKQLDDVPYVPTKAAQDIVNKYKGAVIVP